MPTGFYNLWTESPPGTLKEDIKTCHIGTRDVPKLFGSEQD